MVLLRSLLIWAVAAFRPCPEDAKVRSRSDPSNAHHEVSFYNRANHDLTYWWIDFDGNEHFIGIIGEGDTNQIDTFAGHVIRMRSLITKKLISDFRIPAQLGSAPLIVEPCGGERQDLYEPGRETEFEKLASPTGPCGPAGHSSTWSCFRVLNSEQFNQRKDSAEWGFAPGEHGPRRSVGETEDWYYVDHTKDVPNVTSGDGFLIMNMTQRMRDIFYPWYEKHLPLAQPHEVISGGYTNSHIVRMSKMNLDDFDIFGNVRLDVVREMRQIMQWWTGVRLRHTSTFGVRVYRRDSMLVDHFDIADTHIASAVLQVGQEVDEDGGWPLELVTTDGRYVEVYLQPGQMVLYEGARIKHGRPMRFKGTAFANIFSHFAPTHDWDRRSVEKIPGADTVRARTTSMEGDAGKDEL